jgi:hypothetical protein
MKKDGVYPSKANTLLTKFYTLAEGKTGCDDDEVAVGKKF